MVQLNGKFNELKSSEYSEQKILLYFFFFRYDFCMTKNISTNKCENLDDETPHRVDIRSTFVSWNNFSLATQQFFISHKKRRKKDRKKIETSSDKE